MNETNHTKFKKRAAALAVASCMSLTPWFAQAAGLGKLTVLSALGQPLRAELDIGATKEEMAGMTARLAPQDAFKQAGIDFTTILLDLRFSVEKRANGQSVVKVSSAKPINEPFLDFLVELNWPAGRLVREYTFLLDPPEILASQASRPVAEARIVETVRGGGAAEGKSASVKAATRSDSSPKVATEPKAASESTGGRVVRQGETLRKIADESKYEGVSLEQMLVGLFQSNPDAFSGKNVNRLKAGAILSIPEKSAVEAVSPAEAKKIYVAQAADWNAYRQKLAASTAKTPAQDESAGAQASSGKITAKVEEKVAPAEQSKDQVKVARTDAAAKGAAAAKAAEAADQIAKDKALKEAQDRMALLEKNVNELQKLLEMKNQKLAELQQPVKKEEPKAPEPVKPVEPPKPVEAAKPEPKLEEPAKPVEPPKVAEEAKPIEPPKPEAPKIEEKPKVVAPPPPTPAPAPVVEESLLDDPLPLVGGGGILALLAGYFLLKRRRSQSSSLETTAAPMPSSLGPNSVFRMTGGQSVDTGNTPPQTGDFSQTGPGTIDTDEVDPVAEADVYMAYGRDTQAEEILLEALQKDPQRTAIHAKLLEIYANRRSLKQFETLASELYAQTAGVGADWEKVAALGLGLDPSNPLYSSSRSSASADATMVAAPVEALQVSDATPEGLPPLVEESESLPEIGLPDDFERDTMVLPKATEDAPSQPVVEAPAADEVGLASDAMTLDFDLGEQTIVPEAKAVAEEAADEGLNLDLSAEANALDFDLGGETPEPEMVATVIEPQGEFGNLEADLGLDVAEQPLLAREQPAVSSPDFSPEGTLVMPSATDDEGLDVGLGTWVGADGEPGISANEPHPGDLPAVGGGSVDTDTLMAQTIVNPMAGTDTLVSADILNFGADSESSALSNTVVNAGVADADSLEFDVKLTDSMFLGQPMVPPEFDIGSINLDLSAEPAQATVEPAAPVEAPAAPEAPVGTAAAHDAQWEEVNTKLDLAKAYEEMGDLEGARELLQEVVSEGSVDLVEQARTILGRIGG